MRTQRKNYKKKGNKEFYCLIYLSNAESSIYLLLTEQFYLNNKSPLAYQYLIMYSTLSTIGAKPQHNMCGASTHRQNMRIKIYYWHYYYSRTLMSNLFANGYLLAFILRTDIIQKENHIRLVILIKRNRDKQPHKSVLFIIKRKSDKGCLSLF